MKFEFEVHLNMQTSFMKTATHLYETDMMDMIVVLVASTYDDTNKI